MKIYDLSEHMEPVEMITRMEHDRPEAPEGPYCPICWLRHYTQDDYGRAVLVRGDLIPVEPMTKHHQAMIDMTPYEAVTTCPQCGSEAFKAFESVSLHGDNVRARLRCECQDCGHEWEPDGSICVRL